MGFKGNIQGFLLLFIFLPYFLKCNLISQFKHSFKDLPLGFLKEFKKMLDRGLQIQSPAELNRVMKSELPRTPERARPAQDAQATLGPSWKSLKKGEPHMRIPFHGEASMSWEVQWPWQVGLAHFLVFLLCASPHLKNSAPCIFWMHLPSWSHALCLVHAKHLCVEQMNEWELLAKMLNNLTWMALHLIHNHMIYIKYA